MRKRVAIAWLVVACAVPFSANAQALLERLRQSRDFQFSVNAGVTYSDNIGRTNDNPKSETSGEAGVTFNVLKEQGRLTADIDGDLQYLTYLNNTYDNALNGGLDGSLVYALLPDRLTWTVQDNFGQSFIDPTVPATQGNIQNLNYFSTGPDFNLPLGPRTSLALDGRWSAVTYESSDFSNRRYSGTAGLVRSLGSRASASINASLEKVEYTDLPTISDYEIRSAYFGFDADGARTQLKLKAGFSSLKDSADTSGGALFSLEIVRVLSRQSAINFDAGSNFGDSADALRRDQGIRGNVGIGDQPAIASADPLRSDYATLAWNISGDRTVGRIFTDFRRDAHERDFALDRTSYGGGASATRRLSPRFSVGLHANYESQKYKTIAIDFNEYVLGVDMSWLLVRGIGLSLTVDRLSGSGESAQSNTGRDYNENRLAARLSYTPSR